MGMKEKFMENMMNQMSFDEKKEMMNEMMEKFFSGMSDDEKQDLMKGMMGKMMGGAGGPGGGMGNPMMQMMGAMMGGEGQGANPMDMCKKMMEGMGQGKQAASFLTPEIRTLFEEWARQMDEEILGIIESVGSSTDAIAARLKISRESLVYFLARLAQQGKITLEPKKS